MVSDVETGWGRDTERERERHRNRLIERQSQNERDRERLGETGRDTETDRQMQRETRVEGREREAETKKQKHWRGGPAAGRGERCTEWAGLARVFGRLFIFYAVPQSGTQEEACSFCGSRIRDNLSFRSGLSWVLLQAHSDRGDTQFRVALGLRF